MYLDFYKFTREPFHITPDPRFLFLSPSHKKALASIFYTVEKRKGLIGNRLFRTALPGAGRPGLKRYPFAPSGQTHGNNHFGNQTHQRTANPYKSHGESRIMARIQGPCP